MPSTPPFPAVQQSGQQPCARQPLRRFLRAITTARGRRQAARAAIHVRRGAGWPWALGAIVLVALALTGPGTPRGATVQEPLLVASAASLRFVLQDVAERYRAQTGREVALVFGATGALARQIENGAPYDIYAAADDRWIEHLTREGLTRPETAVSFAEGRLVLLLYRAEDFPPGSPPPGAELDGQGLRHVAVANPELAPYGLAARQVLQAAGLWQRLNSRLVYGDNVRQVERFVTSGNADAGLVALSVVNAPPARWRLIARGLHAPIRHTLVVLRRCTRTDEALRFAALLQDAPGTATLRRYGLSPLEQGH